MSRFEIVRNQWLRTSYISKSFLHRRGRFFFPDNSFFFLYILGLLNFLGTDQRQANNSVAFFDFSG